MIVFGRFRVLPRLAWAKIPLMSSYMMCRIYDFRTRRGVGFHRLRVRQQLQLVDSAWFKP